MTPDGVTVPSLAVDGEKTCEGEEIGKGGTRDEKFLDKTLVALLEGDGTMLADTVDAVDGLFPVPVAPTKVVLVEFKCIV